MVALQRTLGGSRAARVRPSTGLVGVAMAVAGNALIACSLTLQKHVHNQHENRKYGVCVWRRDREAVTFI